MTTAPKKVVVFGSGDQARMVQVYLAQDSPHEVVAFTVPERYLGETKLRGVNMVSFERVEEVYPPGEFAMFVAMGFGRINQARAEGYVAAKQKGYELISYVCSKVVLWGKVEIGENAFILDDTVIHPFTKIGNNVCIPGRCAIGHDVVIGDHCFIAPNAVILGHVTIEPYCFIGASATLRNGVRIAPRCVVGAGAIILKDTRERGVYMAPGTPTAVMSSDLLTPFFGAPRQ